MNRQGFIGASDAAAVLGVSPWKTPLELYWEKTGESTPQASSIPMEVGKELESYVLRYAEQKLGQPILRQQEVIAHPHHDFIRATIDGAVGDALVEAKTTSIADGWGDDGTDEIPIYYVAQCQHQMAVATATMVYVPVLIANRELRMYVVRRDDQIIDTILTKEIEFWDRVKNLNPPEPTTAPELRKVFYKDDGNSVVADAIALEQVDRLRLIRADLKELEAEDDRICESLMRLLKTSSALIDPTSHQPLITWKAAKESTRTDWKQIAEQLLATVDQEIATKMLNAATTTAPGSRRFLLKK